MDELDFNLALQAISTLCFFLGIFIIKGFKQVLDELQKSVVDLNLNITKLIEKDLFKDKRLDSHKSLIEKQEVEITDLREKYYSLINDVTSQIELNKIKTNQIEKILQGN
jgi:hypothetical protein